MFQELENENINDEEAALNNRASSVKSTANKRESKLIELNLSNNKFVKIPECLSCLAPKLIKLNLSSNRIESMGAVCDLPVGLKFFDLSNNFIKRSMHLINENLLRFILYYYSKYTSNALNEDFLNNTLVNLLLENDFCYLNIILKSLNKNNMTDTSLKMSSPRGPAALSTPMYLMNSDPRASATENMRAMSKQRLPPPSSGGNNLQVLSNSQQQVAKRRARSQSRSARTLLASPPINSLPAANQSTNSPQMQSNVVTQKRLLPFDLFLVNLKYNQTYSSSNSGYREPPTNRQELLKGIYEVIKSDFDLERKEKILLNSQNLQVFLEQLCPHKRHIKLESLKSINLSQNKLKKFDFMFELAGAQCSVEDLEKLNQPKKEKQVIFQKRFFLRI
jgi:hypothetical protein